MTQPSASFSTTASLEHRLLGAPELDALFDSFKSIYCSAFSATQRRRIDDRSRADDGELPGPSIRELLSAGRARLDAYFQREKLVGIALSIDLGNVSLGDYMAKDPARLDLPGLGVLMLADWLARTRALDQDAVAEVEAPDAAPACAREGDGPSAARTRRRRDRIRRVKLFERLGFRALEASYSIPGGGPMLLLVHPRPSRAIASPQQVSFAPDEVRALVASVHATYSPSLEQAIATGG